MKEILDTRIFVVDDDPFYLHIVAQELKQKHFKNVHLFNEGAACLESLDLAPEVIILDYRMETLNGLEVLKKVKKLRPETIIFFLTGQKQLKVAVEVMKFGAADYIEKGDEAAKELTSKIYSVWEKLHINSLN